MAVRHGYGKIAGADALVFAYDTGDTRNSYKGEPTVNLASNPDFSNGTTGWNANQNVTLSVETINNIRFLKVKSNQTNSTPGFKSGNITVSGNTTYTLTIRAYKNDSKSIWLYATGNGTGGSDIVWSNAAYNGPNPITTELTTISRTFTTPSDMTYLQIGALWSTPFTTSEVYVEYMQLEQKSHATQFVNGTRSATQGLLDLTGNSTIDISAVSFDSSAQKVFDGTDDYISIASSNTITDYSQPFTIECVFMVDPAATWDNGYRSNIFSIGGSYAGMYGLFKYNNTDVGIQLRDADSTTYAVATNLSKGVYYHLVGTSDGTGTVSLYLNGTLTQNNTGTLTGAPDTQNLFIGGARAFGGAYGNHYQGEIPVTKYYNRALTAAEVKNNYNNYKGRFNI